VRSKLLKKEHKTYVARHDPAHCLAPGLFRSLQRGERKKLKLDVTYRFEKDDVTVRFTGFEPLGADDLRVLQGLVAIAGAEGDILPEQPHTDVGKELRALLEVKGQHEKTKGMAISSSLYGILQEIGLTYSGANVRALKNNLVRLSNVTVIVQKGTIQGSFHLLSYAFDEKDGRLWVGLNPQVTQAILGRCKYTHISMDEVRAIKGDVTRLIHQRLCAIIFPGRERKITMDTLLSYAYCNSEPKTQATVKKRRQNIRKALEELVSLGWEVTEYAQGRFEISRPAKSCVKVKKSQKKMM